MTQTSTNKSATYPLLGLVALAAAGCLPYAYPTMSYVHGTDALPPDCTAFRVDATLVKAYLYEETNLTISVIRRGQNVSGTLPPQLSVTADWGLFGPLIGHVGDFHATCVRLYRPGYHWVELAEWKPVRDLDWEEAANWAEQERVLDALLKQPPMMGDESASRQGKPPREYKSCELNHGSPSPSPEARAYLAAEYERVAALAANPTDAARLRDKARRLVEIKPASTALRSPESAVP